MRDETEWVELVEVGWNRLIGAGAKSITAAISEITIGQLNEALYGYGHTGGDVVVCLRRGIAEIENFL